MVAFVYVMASVMGQGLLECENEGKRGGWGWGGLEFRGMFVVRGGSVCVRVVKS